ncbi:MAG: hypothetical protein EAZ31_00225 [Cytophagia bacterium]|nr:MAG: hypothetical protein EAZ31_00225 [Cytophagia bacterium]
MSGCKKPKGGVEPQDDPDLPPKTQTGANTFGCRINGAAWTPKGIPFSYSSLVVSYDPNFYWGTLNITARRFYDNGSSEIITLFSDSLKTTGTYPLNKLRRQEALFFGRTNTFRFDAGDAHERVGSMIVNKLDLQNAIISGTFEFTLTKPECTVTVTKGRFDLKL